MLSQAHPISILFETIEQQPMNYLQAIEELMVNVPVIPPKLDLATKFNVHRPSPAVESTMELDLQKINSSSLDRYKSAFYKLYEFVTKSKIFVSFPGLNNYKRKYTKDQCCSWFSQHHSSSKQELVQVLSAIEAQSKPSDRQWIIEVTNG